MKRSKKSFRHESLQDAESIQDLLKSLNRGFTQGKLVFRDEEDEITMLPEGLMNLKVTASQEENRYRMNIRISWQSDEGKKLAKKTLNISSS